MSGSVAAAPPRKANRPADPVAEARAAFARGDLAALLALEPRTRSDPLAPTVTAWRMTLQILRDDPALDPDTIERFLATHRGTEPAERVTRALAQRAVTAGDWEAAHRYLTALQLPDATSRCWLAHAELARGTAVSASRADTARTLLAQLTQSNDACTAFFQEALARGLITEEMVVERYFATLIERGSSATHSWLPLLPADSALEKQLSRLATLAKSDPVRAWETREALPAALRPLAERAAFLIAARQGHPVALLWWSRVTPSNVWHTPTYWQVRLALAAEAWPALEALLNALPADERTDRPWRFWRAWTLKALGKGEAARRLFAELAQSDDFFGLFAAEMIEQPFAVHPEPPPTAADRQRVATVAPLTRVRALAARGWLVEAQREAELLGRLWRDSAATAKRRAAAALLVDEGHFDLAIRLLEASQDRTAWSLRYPTPWRQQVLASARAKGVDPAWVYGVMRQESRFRKEARSTSGALGLMQVMPETGRWLARKLNEPRFHPNRLLEPETNLRYGITYLRLMTEQLDGHPVLATGAYNAGPGRIQRLRARHDLTADAALLDALRYIELLPIDETRDYIRKVLANTVVYSHLLGEPKRLTELLLAYNDPTPQLSELKAQLHSPLRDPIP